MGESPVLHKIKNIPELKDSSKVAKFENSYLKDEEKLKKAYHKFSKILNRANEFEDLKERMVYLRDTLYKVRERELLMVFLTQYFPQAVLDAEKESVLPYYIAMSLQTSKCNINFLMDNDSDVLLERILPEVSNNPGGFDVLNRLNID